MGRRSSRRDPLGRRLGAVTLLMMAFPLWRSAVDDGADPFANNGILISGVLFLGLPVGLYLTARASRAPHPYSTVGCMLASPVGFLGIFLAHPSLTAELPSLLGGAARAAQAAGALALVLIHAVINARWGPALVQTELPDTD
jgi:hypothetical protein